MDITVSVLQIGLIMAVGTALAVRNLRTYGFFQVIWSNYYCISIDGADEDMHCFIGFFAYHSF